MAGGSAGRLAPPWEATVASPKGRDKRGHFRRLEGGVPS